MNVSVGLLSVAVVASALLIQGSAWADIVAGKVAAVEHEKIQVNNAWLDKVSVTVESCKQPGALEVVEYSPASIGDQTALGHLFDHDIHHARTPNMRQQQMPNGYGIFWVDANKKVQRTGLLGHQVDCSHVQALVDQFK